MAYFQNQWKPRIKKKYGQNIGHTRQNIQRKLRRGFGFSTAASRSKQRLGFGG